jgi:hypothetical protein
MGEQNCTQFGIDPADRRRTKRFSAGLLRSAILVLGISACQPNAPFRPQTDACVTNPSDNDPGCAVHSLEQHPLSDFPGRYFLLGFVEIDDQGEPYIRPQINALFSRIEEEARYKDLSIIIYVHGWKHNDAASDANVMEFRGLLREMAEMELRRAPTYWPAREIVGIYIGWRGLSVDAGEVAEDLTFWTRMAAAHRVAEGSVREVLARAKALRDAIDETSWPGHSDVRSTRLVIIGHSFGGLIVYTALSQYFLDRAVETGMADYARSLGSTRPADDKSRSKEISGYGDLVIVVNPAIEAIRYEPIREVIETRRGMGSFAPNQNPVFVEVTSSADWATGLAFPAGRVVDTIFESFTGDGERREAMLSFGHYPPFWTHRLQGPTPIADPNLQLPPIDVDQECRDFAQFNMKERPGGYLKPGWRRQYRTKATLTQLARSDYDPNDPFWIVTTDQSMITGHNDIEEPVFVDFVRQLYDDLVRLKDQVPCAGSPAPRLLIPTNHASSAGADPTGRASR